MITTELPRPGATSYADYYRLVDAPFTLTPNPRFVYLSASYLRALDQITHALERREGLIVLTGEIGTGKTTLCRTLVEHLPRRTFLSVILNPFLTADDLLKQILRDFGVISDEAAGARASSHELVTALHKFLASLVPLDAHAVIMIDEAQHLDPLVLEQIRLLSNFETDTAKLLQIILVGQPDLDDLLARPVLRQLNQRVARRCRLDVLTPAEVGHYIERRLWVAHGFGALLTGAAGTTAATTGAPPQEAGVWRVRFASFAVHAIAKLSRGVPRVINLLCDRALEIGAERHLAIVDRPAVLEGARRLELSDARPGRVISVRRDVIAATALVIASVGWFSWWLLGTNRTEVVRTPEQSATATATVTAAPAATKASDITLAPRPALPTAGTIGSSERFTLVAAAFKGAQKANGVAAELAASGLHAFTRMDATGRWHLVLVGPYTSRDEAQRVRRRLADLDYEDAKIIVDRP